MNVSNSFQADGKVALIFCPLKLDMITSLLLAKRKGEHFKSGLIICHIPSPCCDVLEAEAKM